MRGATCLCLQSLRLGRNFNPRTPCGVRQTRHLYFLCSLKFQSTHPLRGATEIVPGDLAVGDISIHAPLAGCDGAGSFVYSSNISISIHAPLAGCDLDFLHPYGYNKHFNPRTPCGVRPPFRWSLRHLYHFNPRTPCGVRLFVKQGIVKLSGISIHAPLAGCDQGSSGRVQRQEISIHAPLAGCDFGHWEGDCVCGKFQSTHPLRGATRSAISVQRLRSHFNPRTPCGVRQQNCRNIPGKFAQKLQNFCKAKQRAALPRVGQRESGRYFRPCAVRTSRGKPERFRFASDNERALRSVARLCAEVLDAGFILVSKVIKA